MFSLLSLLFYENYLFLTFLKWSPWTTSSEAAQFMISIFPNTLKILYVSC
jgi:hypothetical protein